MENLSIKKNNSTITDNLVRIGDLVYFEGPLLTLFEDTNNGRLYVFDWVDRDAVCNRWLLYRVSATALLAFIEKKIDHSELFKSISDNRFYVADIETNHRIIDYTLSELNDVPSKYLPNAETYFDESDCPALVKIRATTIKALSNTKQVNDYLPLEHFMLTSAIPKNSSFNKINHPLNNSSFSNTISLKIKPTTNSPNQYDKKAFLNTNWKSISKQTNKIYA
jgi:hypothetical protein